MATAYAQVRASWVLSGSRGCACGVACVPDSCWRCPCAPLSCPQPEAAFVGSDENAGHDLGGPHVIATLEGHGIPASDIKKLQEAGIHTVEALAHAPVKTLNAIKGLSEVKVTKLKQAGASRLLRPAGVPGQRR